MKKTTLLLSVLAVIAVLMITGCSNTTTNDTVTISSTDTKPIKIGYVGPLSGGAAAFGENGLAGAMLAANEINAQGGIQGRQIEIIAEDSACSSLSVTAVQKLINSDKVIALVGPVCSASAGPAMPIAQNAKLPTVMQGASAPDLTAIGDHIFRVYPSDSFQGYTSADVVFNKLQAEKVAVIYVQDDWGEGLQRVFKETFRSFGGEVVYQGSAPATDTDFRTQLERIKASGAEVLYAPLQGHQGIALFKQAQEIGLNIPIVGGDHYASNDVIESQYSEGVIYVLAKLPTPTTELESRIQSVKGFENLEVNILAPLGYDAMKVIIDSLERAGNNPDALRDAIAETNIVGLSNPKISFDEIGDLENAQSDVLQIKNKQSVPFTG